MHRDDDLQEARAGLVAEHAALTALSIAAATERKPVELDQQSVGRLSRMDAMQIQAMAIESERRRQLRLRRIEAAIGRVDTGEYGYCVRCGEAIARLRLAADPTTPLCADCARKSAA